MGNALHTLNDLIYFRIWTPAEVAQVQEALRRRRTVMALDEAHFSRLFAAKSPEVKCVFKDIDTDFDGKVDTFEVLLVVILWSKATWSEKRELLFKCFDFNAKGFLRLPELLFMASTASAVLSKFARLEPGLEDLSALQEAVSAAFGGEQTELGADGFGRWFEESAVAQKLRNFVDEHTAVSIPEVVESPLRQRVRVLDYGVQELKQSVDQTHNNVGLLDAEDVDRASPQQQQYEVLRKSIESALGRLTVSLETMQAELVELTSSLNQEAKHGDVAALVVPATKQRHEQLLREVEVLHRQGVADHMEASDILGKMIELTFGLPPPPTPGPPPGSAGPLRSSAPSAAFPPLVTKEEDAEAQKRRLRLLDRELKKQRAKKPAESSLVMNENGELVSAPEATGGNAAAGAMFTEPSAAAVPADPAEAAVGAAGFEASPPGVAAEYPPPTATLAPVDAGALPQAGAGEEAAPAEGGEDEEPLPIVVAFADFDPPESHETMMLTLRVGDEIVATGQDGQGWWYGKKPDGSEGWFPPSYVQLKEETPPDAGA